MNTRTLFDLLSHTTLKGAAVLLVALLLGLALRRTAAAHRYALWITAIATLAVLPLAMMALPAWHVLPQTDVGLEWPEMEPEPVIASAAPVLPPADLPVIVSTARPVLPTSSQIVTPPSFSWNISWQDVVGALPVVWMLIAGLLLLRLGRSAWRLHRLEASLRPGECALLIKVAHELGLRRIPLLLIGPSDSVPMVWGVLKPRLLLPLGFESWSPEKQRGVLLHELAHLKRGDPLALWAAQWVKALHWFNPLVWLTFRQLRADQERACDDAVLRHGVRASDYAQSLLDLSRHNRLAPGLSLCALTITRCAPVEARVKAILDPTRRRESLTLRWLAGLSACALLITLPVAMLHAIEGPTLRGRILDRNGVVLAESTKEKVRNYPLKTLAAHLIGYTRTPGGENTEIFGAAALEKQQDATLGEGKDLTLTLDARIQTLALRAMKDGGVERGAAVVLDPRTGEILAMVSLPSFDPNVFVPAISQGNWKSYLEDRDAPLLNRCVKGFVPGSAFKLLTGLAGGAAGISGQKFDCTGSVTYGKSVMQCWIQRQNGGKHGVLGMSEALAASCSCYWYQFGNAAGIDHIESIGRKIGFGGSYGIIADENKGVLPGPAWLKENRPGEKWSAGYTANASIGQGMVVATPLQMAVLAATVGNGGKVPQPGILKQNGASSWRVDLTRETLTAVDVDHLREGMRLVVNSDPGTGQRARSDKVIIAGKTGTAQNWRRDAKGVNQADNNTWFIGFAPFDKPTLAFAILKQGGKSGGGDCAPIAKRIVEETLALPADGSGEVLPLEEPLTEQQQAGARFDAKAEVLKAAIEGIKPDAATGFKLDEITVRNGQVVIRGVASGMIQALQFRDALQSLKWEEPLEWVAPVPQTLADGKRVGFAVLGVLASKVKNVTALEEVRASLASLNDQRSHVWEVVRKKAGLAAIPSGRTALRGEVGDSAIHFYLLQKEVAGWLRDSLDAQVDVGWLETGDPKTKSYPAKSGYEIEVTAERSPAVFKVTVKPLAKTTAAATPAKFEFDTAETSRQIKALSAEPGVVVKEFKMGQGKVTVLGESSGMIPARKYLFKLLEQGRERNVRWSLPTIKALENQSVQIEASGTYGAEALHDAPSDPKASASSKPANQAQLPVSDDVIRLQPELAKQWTHLKAAGLLADLPAEAVVLATERLEKYLPSLHVFGFSIPQKAARRWLLDSVFDESQREKILNWPSLSASFNGVFTVANRCSIIVSCLNGGTVYLTIYQMAPPDEIPKMRPFEKLRPFRPILIAPDESQEPQPTGKLAPEYHGKGFTQIEAKPTLEVALQTLRPTITPQDAQLPTFRPQPNQYRVQAPAPPSTPTLEMPFPLNRLHGDLSAESEKALRRSVGSGTRMQQALVVRAPQSM